MSESTMAKQSLLPSDDVATRLAIAQHVGYDRAGTEADISKHPLAALTAACHHPAQAGTASSIRKTSGSTFGTTYVT